ncbi:hypothetical protein BpHYR1_054087 [Brachionus plicatilis]|uniref:Uncharacterized protein n=1 Tax=Brachionus plicatilis TaxID=10195 RepID=A0A3M7RXE7_BRAPC|nr:hypothetical protein BpHYR1_054087 [Brachionus plicatilis]
MYKKILNLLSYWAPVIIKCPLSSKLINLFEQRLRPYTEFSESNDPIHDGKTKLFCGCGNQLLGDCVSALWIISAKQLPKCSIKHFSISISIGSLNPSWLSSVFISAFSISLKTMLIKRSHKMPLPTYVSWVHENM